jgi:hypothetical protein
MDAIVALDADQRILLFNPAAEPMIRCSAAFDRFLPARFRVAHRRPDPGGDR